MISWLDSTGNSDGTDPEMYLSKCTILSIYVVALTVFESFTYMKLDIALSIHLSEALTPRQTAPGIGLYCRVHSPPSQLPGNLHRSCGHIYGNLILSLPLEAIPKG